jgi:hypothetical protein
MPTVRQLSPKTSTPCAVNLCFEFGNPKTHMSSCLKGQLIRLGLAIPLLKFQSFLGKYCFKANSQRLPFTLIRAKNGKFAILFPVLAYGFESVCINK